MIQCQNCGQGNAPESQFCRFCGTKFLISPPMPQQQQDYGYQAPRPYSWKTDEFQTQAEARKQTANAAFSAQPLANRDQQYMAGNYRCPNCMSQFLPRIERRISTTGWIVFAVLLVLFFPLFWVGLLIKEDVQICPSCNLRLK
jgi:hypothetical protein